MTDGPPEVERRKRGLLDTSAVIDLDRLVADDLPLELAVSAITMAELAAGPHATSDPQERAGRIERLQAAEATFDTFPSTRLPLVRTDESTLRCSLRVARPEVDARSTC